MCNVFQLGRNWCVTDTSYLFVSITYLEKKEQMFKKSTIFILQFAPSLHFTESAVCILHSVCILPLQVHSLQSAVYVLQ